MIYYYTMAGIWNFIVQANLVLVISEIGNTDTFSDRALATITIVEMKLQMGACIEDAQTQARQIESGDRYYAAFWFGMYSRHCLISQDLLQRDKKENSFPFRLNKELRCQHTSYSDTDTINTFLKVAETLDQSVDIIGQTTHDETYRGVSTYLKLYEEKDTFVEESFVSVSKSVDVGLEFAENQVLMIVYDYKGVDITNYVEKQFTYQKEVLGKSVKAFNVERRTSDLNDIATIMSTLDVNRTRYPDNPAHVLIIREITLSQQELDEMIKDQAKYFEDYCFSSSDPRMDAESVKYVGFLLIFYAVAI